MFARKQLLLVLWLAVLLTPVSLLAMPAPEPEWQPEVVEQGYLSAYAPHVMGWQVDYRIETGEAEANAWERFDTFVAVLDCGAIGEIIYLRPVDKVNGRAGEWVEALVVDCAGHIETVQWMRENRILAEVDHETWQRWQPYRTGYGLGVEVAIDG